MALKGANTVSASETITLAARELDRERTSDAAIVLWLRKRAQVYSDQGDHQAASVLLQAAIAVNAGEHRR